MYTHHLQIYKHIRWKVYGSIKTQSIHKFNTISHPVGHGFRLVVRDAPFDIQGVVVRKFGLGVNLFLLNRLGGDFFSFSSPLGVNLIFFLYTPPVVCFFATWRVIFFSCPLRGWIFSFLSRFEGDFLNFLTPLDIEWCVP